MMALLAVAAVVGWLGCAAAVVALFRLAEDTEALADEHENLQNQCEWLRRQLRAHLRDKP